MGNRAVIINKNGLDADGNIREDTVGVYMHWNGSRSDVEAFLAYCEMQGYRSPSKDCYGWAYLVTTICNFFGDGLSCGIDTTNHLDLNNWDNGVYVIDNWNIVGRLYYYETETPFKDLKYFAEVVEYINKAQPEHMQISDENLKGLIEKYLAPGF